IQCVSNHAKPSVVPPGHQKMPGTPVFVIGHVAIRRDAPEAWSYSALKGFDDCPRRWALGRTEIPCFGGTVPQKPSRSGLEGSLLHSLIERYARHTTQIGAEVFRPRRTLLELIA